jgi:hypothetical protein
MLWRKHGHQDIVFLGRDCQLLHRIYSAYYKISYYLPFSRQVAFTQTKEAIDYLSSHMSSDTVLVDISSTGGTWQHISSIKEFPITVLIYSDVAFYTKEKPILSSKFDYLEKNSVCGQTNLLLELFNCGDHGYLESLQHMGNHIQRASFAKPELGDELIKTIHQPVNNAVALANYYNPSLTYELSKLSDVDLSSLFSVFVTNVCGQTQLQSTIPDFFNKEDLYLKEIIENAKNN